VQTQDKQIASLQSAMKSLVALLQAEESSAATETTYQVKSGDSLEKIAAQNGTSVKVLKELNALPSDRIKIGQKLKLPAK
jgi:peptidoglycan endopeptidase LytE